MMMHHGNDGKGTILNDVEIPTTASIRQACKASDMYSDFGKGSYVSRNDAETFYFWTGNLLLGPTKKEEEEKKSGNLAKTEINKTMTFPLWTPVPFAAREYKINNNNKKALRDHHHIATTTMTPPQYAPPTAAPEMGSDDAPTPGGHPPALPLAPSLAPSVATDQKKMSRRRPIEWHTLEEVPGLNGATVFVNLEMVFMNYIVTGKKIQKVG